jgi:hypothetical protein
VEWKESERESGSEFLMGDRVGGWVDATGEGNMCAYGGDGVAPPAEAGLRWWRRPAVKAASGSPSGMVSATVRCVDDEAEAERSSILRETGGGVSARLRRRQPWRSSLCMVAGASPSPPLPPAPAVTLFARPAHGTWAVAAHSIRRRRLREIKGERKRSIHRPKFDSIRSTIFLYN